jgi:hypothetical protein
VTGGNSFFTLNEQTRQQFGLVPGRHLRPICPPGTRHLRGATFGRGDWEDLRDGGEAVWILQPSPTDKSQALRSYLELGEKQGIPEAYKCKIRKPWWRPPVVPEPDLFFTYMSHRYPRLINNAAGVTFVNSMHGVRLKDGLKTTRQSLPLLTLNSVTMLGAEIFGRSYGGGILKMEPREAARLPVPKREDLARAWARLKEEKGALERSLRNGEWSSVVTRVDEVLLSDTLGISTEELNVVAAALATLRKRRLSRDASLPASTRA